MIPLGVLGASRTVAAGGGGGPLAKTFLGSATDAVNRVTYTITGADLGTASADRHIVVATAIRVSSQPAPSISTASIAGVSAAVDYRAAGTYSSPMLLNFIRAHVPSGTTGDIVITYTASVTRLLAGWWAVTGAPPTVIDTDKQEGGPASLALTDAADGVVLAVCSMSTDADVTWTGDAIEDTQIVVEGQPAVFASGLTDGGGASVNNNIVVHGANMTAAITYGPA